jgi:dienelactone hydrolase
MSQRHARSHQQTTSLRALRLLAAACASVAALAPASAQDRAVEAESLRVLPARPAARKSEGPLRDQIRRESQAVLARRKESFERLTSAEAIAAYQRDLRARFIASLGGFPERTPLNARVTGELRGEGFRVEKILFESQPGFVVTGLLYLPATGAGPHPVVLMPCGHSPNGKGGYQAASIIMARNGLAVFCFDPIGQGERHQVPRSVVVEDKKGAEGATGGTNEHTILGPAPILLGRGLATYMIWDGIRAIDYLETRRDLDPKRIGCAGNSGGGMMTSYLMALDDRIVSAAPGCFITTSVRKNETPGAGDAEQNIYNQYGYGLDFADYLILRAPRPVQILSATRDYVPIAGAWETFREAKRVYTRLGYPECVDLVETDAPHGYSVQLREASTRWMRRWLCGDDTPIFEQPAASFTNKEIACTPTGEVMALPGARSLYDLNRAEASRLAPLRQSAWAALTKEARRDRVRQTAGIRAVAELPAARVEPQGDLRRAGGRIEKLVLTREGDVPLPALRFRPEKPSGRACLYVHGRGKQIDAAPGGPIARLVAEGVDVLAVDLRGFGETSMNAWRVKPAEIAGDNGAEFYIAYMMGRSFVGLRAEDILVAARAFAGMIGATPAQLELVAVEDATIPALHAVAVAPAQFTSVRVSRAIDSWQRVIDASVPRHQLEATVHGVLRTYDLPDLVALAGRVQQLEPVDAAGTRLN